VILLVCGPPGAGKSTVADRLRDRLAAQGRSFRRLDSDQFSRDTYRRLYERVEGSDADWIVSGTFYKREWQARFERLEDVVVVYLQAALETCLERNRQRAAPIDEAAVHIVWREFDEPDADITISVNERSVEAVVDRVLAALDALPDVTLPPGDGTGDGSDGDGG
jgi:tRNA uridine 5-carbamoylmethylation protein Kti12